MMRGHNEMHLNEATMTEALQEWMDRRLVAPGQTKVVGVSEDTRNNYNGRIFVIKTEEAKPDAS